MNTTTTINPFEEAMSVAGGPEFAFAPVLSDVQSIEVFANRLWDFLGELEDASLYCLYNTGSMFNVPLAGCEQLAQLAELINDNNGEQTYLISQQSGGSMIQ